MPKPGETEDIDSTNDDVEETKNQGSDDADESADDSLEGGDEGSSDADDEGSDDSNELREKLHKAEEQRDKNFARAKKAEGWTEKRDDSGQVMKDENGKVIWVKKSTQKPSENANKDQGKQTASLSEDDIFEMVSTGVTHKEDRATVKKFAKANDMTIAEALQDKVLKSILANDAEERKTSQATNRGSTRRSTARPSGDQLLNKFSQTGEVPDSDEALDDMLEARFTPKKK